MYLQYNVLYIYTSNRPHVDLLIGSVDGMEDLTLALCTEPVLSTTMGCFCFNFYMFDESLLCRSFVFARDKTSG